MATNFDMAKRNYERKTWTQDMLQVLVNKGKLTQEDFNKIVNPVEETKEEVKTEMPSTEQASWLNS